MTKRASVIAMTDEQVVARYEWMLSDCKSRVELAYQEHTDAISAAKQAHESYLEALKRLWTAEDRYKGAVDGYEFVRKDMQRVVDEIAASKS